MEYGLFKGWVGRALFRPHDTENEVSLIGKCSMDGFVYGEALGGDDTELQNIILV
jgi:hypothetical protein